MDSQSQQSDSSAKPLTAFVSFPSPYTQALLVSALVSVIPSLSLTLIPPEENNLPQLQWADYDLLTFTIPHSNPSKYLTSSYVYRKALIRKHQLHTTIVEYVAKSRHRGQQTVLDTYHQVDGHGESGGDASWSETRWIGGGVPQGWVVDIQFADELDELLLDDLYELAEALQENQGKEGEEQRWFILKPGFADRAQGIRMFSTEEELRAIFESFEPPSDDETQDEDEIDEEDDDVENEEQFTKRVDKLGIDDEEEEDADDDENIDQGGTGVMTSHLRHFVIQEYLPRPMLFDFNESPSPDLQLPPNLQGYKFHLRAYALITGGYTVHLARTMLALFSGSPYTHPRSSQQTTSTSETNGQGEFTLGTKLDLRPHLTNTCLQTDAFGAPTPPEHLVKLFWDLQGMTAVTHSAKGEGMEQKYEVVGKVEKEWLEETFESVGEVIAEAVKAGAECGSFGLQLVPNAFEIFGVDLILSYPPDLQTTFSSTRVSRSKLPKPRVTLLEFNASPDFHQSGDKLRPQLGEMFRGVVRISVMPFFGLKGEKGEKSEERREENEKGKSKEGDWAVGEERFGWTLVRKGEVRGQWT